jgi:L-amino acid N-acyltransferase YncA
MENCAVALGFIPDDARDYRESFAEKIASQTTEFKIWVAESVQSSILGWQSLLPTQNNPAIRPFVAESSTYVAVDNEYKGVGTAIMRHALKQAERSRLQRVVGFVLASNLPMLRLFIRLVGRR